MTVLFVTVGSLGDLFPYLTIARELKARGHRCIVAAGQMHRRIVEDSGVAFHEIRPDLTNHGDAPEWIRMATHPRRASEFIIRRMILPFLRDTYGDLEPAAARADCIVAHPLSYAGKLAAERYDVPLVVAALQPSIFFSSYDPPVVARTPTRGAVRALGRPFYLLVFGIVRLVMRAWAAPIRRFRRELGLPRLRTDALVEGQYSGRLNLALFSPLLALPDPDWPPQTVQTGFVFHDRLSAAPGDAVGLGDGQGLGDELEGFLASGPPPVVFTLGSLVVMNPGGFFTESLAAVRRLGARAVFLTAGGESEGLDGERDVFVAGYVSHAKLFPRASAVVHQGGIGTTAEALRAGRPQLVVPFANDQPDNAHRVGRLGVGRVLSPRSYRADRVASELAPLLRSRVYAQRAVEVAGQIARERGTELACDAIESRSAQPQEINLQTGGTR